MKWRRTALAAFVLAGALAGATPTRGEEGPIIPGLEDLPELPAATSAPPSPGRRPPVTTAPMRPTPRNDVFDDEPQASSKAPARVSPRGPASGAGGQPRSQDRDTLRNPTGRGMNLNNQSKSANPSAAQRGNPAQRPQTQAQMEQLRREQLQKRMEAEAAQRRNANSPSNSRQQNVAPRRGAPGPVNAQQQPRPNAARTAKPNAGAQQR